MDLTNEFTVPVPVERAWEVLNDVELIAPCLPGAQLQEIEGDEYRGVVKVKVGPITAQYKGAATFQEQDEANRKIVLKAEGRDTRGQGSASALITATMTESGSGADVSTHVVVESDVTIKGKVAQFGRGMIAEVSAKLLTQFVECLEGKLEADPSGDTPGDDATEAAKAQSEAAATTSEPPGATDGDDVAIPAVMVSAEDGDVVLVASYGGDDRAPAWYHNLRANPTVELVTGGERFTATARTATDEERDALWPTVTSTYKGYAGYQRKTDREIPLVICERNA